MQVLRVLDPIFTPAPPPHHNFLWTIMGWTKIFPDPILVFFMFNHFDNRTWEKVKKKVSDGGD
jgi:hypothetical protein